MKIAAILQSKQQRELMKQQQQKQPPKTPKMANKPNKRAAGRGR